MGQISIPIHSQVQGSLLLGMEASYRQDPGARGSLVGGGARQGGSGGGRWRAGLISSTRNRRGQRGWRRTRVVADLAK